MIDDRTAAGFQRQMSFKQYKKYKLSMLQKDFCIGLTNEELAQFDSLTTEFEVDKFCITILNDRWQ